MISKVIFDTRNPFKSPRKTFGIPDGRTYLLTYGLTHTIKGVLQRPAVKDISRKSPCETYVYIHTCIHTYIHTYIHTHIHTIFHPTFRLNPTYIHTYIHTYINEHLAWLSFYEI